MENISELYWKIHVEFLRIIDHVTPMHGHYWTFDEIKDANPGLCLHLKPPYIDDDNKTGLLIEYGADIARRGVDVGLPSLLRTTRAKKWLKVEKEDL